MIFKLNHIKFNFAKLITLLIQDTYFLNLKYLSNQKMDI